MSRMKHNFKIFILALVLVNFMQCQNLLNLPNIINAMKSSNLTKFNVEEDHPCEQKTNIILKYLINNTSEIPEEYSDFYKFALYTGTGINDWGDYFGCKGMNYSKYYLSAIVVPNTSLTLSFGLCYFKECDLVYMNKVKYDIASLLQTQNITVDPEMIFFSEPEQNLKVLTDNYFSGLIVSIIIISLFILANLAQCYVRNQPVRKSTLLYDADLEKKSTKGFLQTEDESNQNKSKFFKVLEYFDFAQNVTKIFEIKNPDETHRVLRIFDGIRILSTMWVVFGHTFNVSLLGLGYKNSSDFLFIGPNFRYSLLLSAFYAVDVFFYMSGFLLYFGLKKYLDKKVNTSQIMLMAVVNRYLRLLPLYLFILLPLTYIMPFIGDGPMYNKVNASNQHCESNFWHNLLYINNVVDYDATSTMCAGHTWYLANDMQFFLIFMGIFLFLNNQRIIRIVIFIVIFVASCVISMVQSIDKGYHNVDISHIEGFVSLNGWFEDFYIKPWIRVCPYILGLFFCEFFFETPIYLNDVKGKAPSSTKEDTNIIRRINNYFIDNNWASFALFIFALILVIFTFFCSVITNTYEVPIVYHALFLTFNKILFVFGLGLIVHLTFLGKFTFVYKILSMEIFSGLGRISYGIYLMHYYVLLYYFSSSYAPSYLKLSDFLFLTLGIFIVTSVVSLLVSVTIESPFVNLLKNLTIPNKKKTEKVATQE